MIYVLSTYRPTGGFEQLRLAREDDAWPALKRAGAVPLGLWQVLLGGSGDALELVRYDSLVHWRRAAADSAGPSDTQPAQAIAMRPITRRQPGGEPVQVSRESVWALRRMEPRAGEIPRIASLTEDRVWPGFFSEVQAGGRQYTLGMFVSHVAERQEILMLSYYAAIGDWEETRAGDRLAGSSDAGRLSAQSLAERATLINGGGVRLLSPLSSLGPTSASCIEASPG